ncbi:hypothetical protein [Kineosporia sp. NBRC 101677]|uniref:hypothetical protein n=1 Tax=Kineosporia sp. NBRC 101677 TaxID=3032197 RepID=UPI0025573BBA|nr:hypothetical protein [Kineosporia sp. NBRC 101677]
MPHGDQEITYGQEDAVLGVDGETRVRDVQVDEFQVRSSDLTFRLDVAIDLERLVTAAPARWAVSALAEQPHDQARRERAVAAVRAVGKSLREGTSRFDLAVVRIGGEGMPGGLLVLYGQEPRTGERLAYILTPAVRVADLLAADRGQLARELVDGLSPLDVSGTLEGSWEVRVKDVLSRLGPWLISGADEVSSLSIVRAEPTPAPSTGRHTRERRGLGRALGRLGRAAGGAHQVRA